MRGLSLSKKKRRPNSCRQEKIQQIFSIILCFVLVPGAYAADKALGINKKILVNIERQILIAVEANKRVFEYDVVTGRPNKETHPGTFAISRKYEDYTSKTYGSEMPYTMFFTKDGKAIHGTKWEDESPSGNGVTS